MCQPLQRPTLVTSTLAPPLPFMNAKAVLMLELNGYQPDDWIRDQRINMRRGAHEAPRLDAGLKEPTAVERFATCMLPWLLCRNGAGNSYAYMPAPFEKEFEVVGSFPFIYGSNDVFS